MQGVRAGTRIRVCDTGSKAVPDGSAVTGARKAEAAELLQEHGAASTSVPVF